MALTFFQRLQVAFRGWSRRREDDARKRDAEFLKRNAGWGRTQSATPAPESLPHARDDTAKQIDREGLQVAYLDDSGQIGYFLDAETGEVVEVRGPGNPEIIGNPGRYKRVPQRGAEVDDRAAFVETLDPSPIREFLKSNINTNDFRKVLAGDRGVERAWYNFKNQRATNAIESWIRSLGLH